MKKYLISTIVAVILGLAATVYVQSKVIKNKKQKVVLKEAEVEFFKYKLQQYNNLANSINIIKKRSPAVGGLISTIQESIEQGVDVTNIINQLPETDLEILNKEMILKHGLKDYAWRSEFGYPVVNPANAYVSSEYGRGWITIPVEGKLKRIIRTHAGIDIVSKHDSRALSVGEGIVCYVNSRHKIYGKMIAIKYKVGNDWYMATYAHLAELKVKYNQKVSKGEVVGVIGTTGESFGIHLHYDLKKYNNRSKTYLTINPVYSTTYGVPVETTRYYGTPYKY